LEKKDFIIVGQGLAGSILALELLKHGKTVLVIDNADLSTCSRVAGGIYNPVVFKRLTKSWMAETVLPYMSEFFTSAENLFGIKLLHPTKIVRIFLDENEEAIWRKKSVNGVSNLIDSKINQVGSSEVGNTQKDFSFIKSNYSFVKQGGFVDVFNFLTYTKNYLQKQNSFLNETFTYSDVSMDEKEVRYKNVAADKIIFCEGHLAVKNPWFNKVKFKPAKGEVLTIYCEELKTDSVITKDIFILPLPEKNHFKIGATYNWDDLTDIPTEEAKNSLLEKLKNLLPYPYKLLDHQAGVRPSTLDHHPAIGFHPEHKTLGFFNGFGTKSVMLVPYFAKHFCNFMENRTELLREVNVKRFF